MKILLKFCLILVFIFLKLSSLTQNKISQWFNAVDNNDIATTQKLISHELRDLKDQNGNTALMIAAQKGYTTLIEELLDNEANPNIQNNHGQTALHFATQNGHAYIAAYLLARGAKHKIKDKHKNLALDNVETEFLSYVKQYYLTIPSLDFKFNPPQSPFVTKHVNELRKNGIVKISGMINENELKQLQADFRTFIEHVDNNKLTFIDYHTEDFYKPSTKLYKTNNSFKYSTQLVNFCFNKTVLDIINHYHGKISYIQKGSAYRYLPGPIKPGVSFDWHQDGRGRQLKIMILLTDVEEDDQYMTYVLGSHKIMHPYKTYINRTLNLEYCKQYLNKIKIFKAKGKAGDIFIFDDSGVHSGNRPTPGKTRDVFMLMFTTDKSWILRCDLPQEVYNQNVPLNYNPFLWIIEKLKRTNKYESCPCYKLWETHLEDIDSWLYPELRVASK